MNKSTKCAVILYKHGFSGAKQIECKDNQNKTAVEIAFVGQADGLYFTTVKLLHLFIFWFVNRYRYFINYW